MAPDLRLYPLRNSRRSVPAGQRIGSPRHLVVFRTEPDALVVVRLLDERMNLPERLGETR